MSVLSLIALAGFGLLALLLLAVVVLAIAKPDAARKRVLALFRRPARPSRTPGQGHYYKPYWS